MGAEEEEEASGATVKEQCSVPSSLSLSPCQIAQLAHTHTHSLARQNG